MLIRPTANSTNLNPAKTSRKIATAAELLGMNVEFTEGESF